MNAYLLYYYYFIQTYTTRNNDYQTHFYKLIGLKENKKFQILTTISRFIYIHNIRFGFYKNDENNTVEHN